MGVLLGYKGSDPEKEDEEVMKGREDVIERGGKGKRPQWGTQWMEGSCKV